MSVASLASSVSLYSSSTSMARSRCWCSGRLLATPTGKIVELHGALEKIKADSGIWNKSLRTLRLEQEAKRAELSPPKVPL